MSQRNFPDLISVNTDEAEQQRDPDGDSQPLVNVHDVTLRSLIENTEDFILFSDRNGFPVYFNTAYAAKMKELLGEEMRPGLKPHTLLPDPAQRQIWEDCHRRVLGGEQFSFEFLFTPEGGEEITFEVSYNPILQGDEIIGFSEFTRDITERKRSETELLEARRDLERKVTERTAALEESNLALAAEVEQRLRIEDELRASECRFRALAEHSADISVVTGRDGTVTYMAPSIRRYGYEIEDVLGKPPRNFLHPESAHIVEGNIAAAMASPGTSLRVPCFQALTKDGDLFDLEGHMTCLFDVPGVNGVVFNGRDVSARLRLEARLRQVEKMDAIGKLAGGIAHDFNNQLGGIMGNADVLADVLEDPELRECADDIVRAARSASDLTHKLLAFARKGRVVSVPLDIHQVIAEVIALLKHSIDKKICIKQQLDADPSVIQGDPAQIQSALLNLALNARDAMPEGGDLLFATDVEFLDENSAHHHPFSAKAGDYLVVTVTDGGVGMDERTRNQIFEPFFTTKEAGKGTGMGLASVYGTITHHGGWIDVTSELDNGTAIEIHLPLAEGLEVCHADPAIELRRVRPSSVLVIDDEETVRTMLARQLRRLGHTVLKFERGAEAIDYYRTHWREIDAVVLDVVMPGMNGHEVFQALKTVNPEVKVLLSSGYSVAGEASTILRAGACGFLGKPFRLSQLASALQPVLEDRPST